MRALKNGLPLVVVPGLGGDQPVNAAAAEQWKVGRALPGDAAAEMMREALRQVLRSTDTVSARQQSRPNRPKQMALPKPPTK